MKTSLVVGALLAMSAAAASGQDAPQKEAASAAPYKNAVATCGNPIGRWVNQMRSELVISAVNTTTGAVSGQYRTSSGAPGWYPLSGWWNAPPPGSGDNAKILSFSVNWGTSIGSVTSWTGVCRGTGELRTVWYLGRANTSYEWDHVLAGADQFTPQ
jgi:hypothetical protein